MAVRGDDHALAIDARREAFWGEHSGKLILIGYEPLARNPEETLRRLYEFLDEPWFEHDFNDVEYEANDFDLALGTPNLQQGPAKS